MQYGQILTVTPNITSVPGITGTLSYQWKASGASISGATNSTYTLTASEVGKTITCDIISNAQPGTKSATASGTVSKITLSAATVSAVDSKTYNGTTATTGGTISFSGMVNSETPSYTASIVWTSANVGTTTVNVTGISLTTLADRYVLSATSLSNVTPGNNATISKATPTVIVKPTAGAITYGQTLQSSTLTTSSAVVNGYSDAITGSYAWKTSTTQPASAGTFTTATVTFTPTDATHYNSIDFDISVTVTKATLTVSADTKTKIYGETNPTLTFQYSGWLNGDDAEDLTTKPSVSTTVGLVTSAGVHTSAITVAGGVDENYTFAYIPADFTITKATLTVIADAESKVYGAANTTLTFQYSGWLNGDDAEDLTTAPTASSTVTASSPADVYTGAITVTGGVDENYDFTYVSADFSVTKAALAVIANDKSKIYGASDPVLDYIVTGTLYNGDSYSVVTGVSLSTTTGASATFGTHTITATGGTADNYDVTNIDGTLTVSKAPLTVTANDKAKTYGDSDPVLDYTTTGTLYYSDDYSVISGISLNTVTGASATYGTHTIAVSGSSADNYDVTQLSGTLTVSKASLAVTANDKAKVYGATDPVTDYTPSGTLYYSDTYDVISGVTLNTPTGASATYGTHVITASGGSADNYDITHVNGTLTVSKAVALTVSANNKSKVYGASDPVLDYTPSGILYYSDTYSVISGVSLNTETGSSAAFGTHTITATSGSADNYDVNHVNGTLTVSKAAALTVTANDKSKVYGASDPVLDYTPSGTLYYSDTYDVISGVSLITSTGASATFGPHTISASGGSADNYNIIHIDGTLSVSKAALTAVADSKSKIYGETNPLLTITYAGFKYSDNTESLATPPVASTSATSVSNAGSYSINLTEGIDTNYDINNTEGTLTVEKAVLNVTVDNKSRIYGKANPDLTASYSGFLNGEGVDDIDIRPVVSTSADIASDAGKYSITADGGFDNNYIFEYRSGTLEIVKADQVITFVTIPSGLRTTQNHELAATSTSGLPVSFESSENSIAEISGNNMSVLKEGTVVITAVQDGNNNWNPAAKITQSVVTLPTFENIRSLFTPNNDGMNDYWYIPDIEQYGSISVQIYNRFGKLLYKSSAYKNDWDGTYNGAPLPEAAYYYIIKSSEKGLIKGVVNIVR
jgi:gliding motility-associated-like protein